MIPQFILDLSKLNLKLLALTLFLPALRHFSPPLRGLVETNVLGASSHPNYLVTAGEGTDVIPLGDVLSSNTIPC